MCTIGPTENHRPRHASERDALPDRRAGETGRFLRSNQGHCRIRIGGTADRAKQQLISHWSTHLSLGRDVAIRRRPQLLRRGKMLEGW